MSDSLTKTRNILTGFVTAILIFLVTFSGAFAADPSDPDDYTIIDVKVFRNLIETGDILLIAEYNIAYDPTPDDDARAWWLFRVLNDDTLDIGRSLPYSYGQNGYQYGITSMYWDADSDVIPAWNEALQFRIEPNPTAWDDPPDAVTYTLTAADYGDDTSQDENQAALSDWVFDVVGQIEINWDVSGELITITGAGPVLTAAGQHYVLGAVPGSNWMCPDLFAVKDIDLDTDPETWEHERDEETQEQFEDTMIDDFKTLLVDVLGGHFHPFLILGVILFILIVVLFFFSFAWFGSTEPAYVMVPVLVWYWSKMSFAPWAIFGILCFGCAIYTGWLWLGKQSQ